MAKGSTLGSWAFLIGLVVAVILGLGIGGDQTANMTVTLFIIGLVVGLLNIAEKEVTPFLLSGVVLIIASSMGLDAMGGIDGKSVQAVLGILSALLVLFVPATIVVAVKNVFQLAKR